MEANVCKCPHHKIVGLMIVLIGLTFLLQALGVIAGMLVALAWPTFLIIAGVVKIKGRGCKCCVKTA